MWPFEFCMRGYPNYPNNDIQKHITKPLDNNWITGGVYGYKITEKGKNYAKQLSTIKPIKKKREIINEQPRYIKTEFTRIINSKVFKYYLQDKNIDFLESDLFDFLGTSSRSLSTKDRNVFLTRYNAVIKDVIPFCRKIAERDEEAKNIIEIWEILSNKFKDLLNKKVGIKNE
jgi:hypothetical protein